MLNHVIIIFGLVLFVFGQEEDSLSIPEDAQGRPDLPKIVPQPDWDNVCFCSYGVPICDEDQTCKKDSMAACFHAMKEVFNKTSRQMETHHDYGCATLEAGSHGSYFTCKSYLTPQVPPKSIACCYEGHLCNMNITPPPYVNAKEWEDLVEYELLGGGSWLPIGSILLFSVLVTVIVAFLIKWFWNKRKGEKDRLMSSSETEDLLYMDSGSGSGSKALNQRTVAQNLEILETIGRGRYGDVRKATYKGSLVAVKTFSTTDEESWKNERDIYQTTMLNHKNILQYVAADICSEDSITHMLLITDFHELGSLCDYLRRDSALSVKEALDLAHSTICGIEHLHCSLQGTGSLRKPEIAHRDIKSKNIIVKREGVCCIADFGLAVRYDGGRLIPEKVNVQVGTKRYMAPEVLSRSLQPLDFSQFKMSDMYSYALVVWEILRRVEWQDSLGHEEVIGGTATDSSGFGSEESETAISPRMQHMQKPSLDLSTKAKPYVPPYEGMVENDPALEEMRHVVCDEERRPPLENSWHEQDSPLRRLTQLMTECWSSSPASRHTSLKMKMELGRIIVNLKEKDVKNSQNIPQKTWTQINEEQPEEPSLPRSPSHTNPSTPAIQYPPRPPQFSTTKPTSSDSGMGKSRDSSSQKSFEPVVTLEHV